MSRESRATLRLGILSFTAPEPLERLWNPLVDVDLSMGDDDHLD